MSTPETVFAAYALISQVALLAFFAARRWFPRSAGALGSAAYAIGGLGLFVSAWLLASGQSWRLWSGPLLMAAWAAFGACVDLLLKVQWRDPIVPRLFAPYVTLYFFAQMFVWWPLWNVDRLAWLCFAVLFVANTSLNLAGHFGGRGPVASRRALR